ncbi:hypothetical protein GOC13_24535 [Sinorhizobium meliloti]|nr:hypothetical protein [Sinorhizobium meliloti]
MIRKFLIAGLMAVTLASCGERPAPCPTPEVKEQSWMLGEATVMTAGFRSGGFRSSFRSSTRSYSAPRSYSKPSYRQPYRSNNTTIIQNNNSGGSNGLLWGLGGYMLGKQAAEDATRCQ